MDLTEIKTKINDVWMDFDKDEINVRQKEHSDEKGLLYFLDKSIKGSLRILAVLMTVVIFLGVIDVFYILYQKLMAPPKYLLEIGDIFATFSGFMAVLIAIEIYTNIIIYLKDNLIHVRIVMATALMAIARKVIVLDFSVLDPRYLVGIGAVMLSSGVVYWLTYKIPKFKVKEGSKE